MKDVKVTSTIGIQDIKTNIMTKCGAGARLADIAQSIRSNNYNFEEEQLLGCDRIITRQYENDCYRETIEFRTENVNSQYYFLEYYEYDTRPDTPDFDTTIDNKILHIDLYNKDNDTFPQVTRSAATRKLVQEYRLYQMNAQHSPEPISTREIIKDYILENGIYKPMVIERITHGNQFEEYYLVNNTFSRRFTPNNFIIPTNPITYSLQTIEYGCGQPLEQVDTVMNSSYYDQFDSGVSFYMKGATYYYEGETPITPAVEDNLVFNNGKFIYAHSTKRTFSTPVTEVHYFILPVVSSFFPETNEDYSFLKFHGKMLTKSGNKSSGYIKPEILIRTNQTRVEDLNRNDRLDFNDLEVGEEFTLSTYLPQKENDYIQFLGFYIGTSTASDPFSVEIDAIQRS